MRSGCLGVPFTRRAVPSSVTSPFRLAPAVMTHDGVLRLFHRPGTPRRFVGGRRDPQALSLPRTERRTTKRVGVNGAVNLINISDVFPFVCFCVTAVRCVKVFLFVWRDFATRDDQAAGFFRRVHARSVGAYAVV